MAQFLTGLAFGIIVGWMWRSFRFGIDEDCANPNHKRAYHRDEWDKLEHDLFGDETQTR